VEDTPSEDTAISTVSSDSELLRTEYFDLSGRRVAAPAGGLYLRRSTYRDGKVKSAVVRE
jgi:hypothetical protein